MLNGFNPWATSSAFAWPVASPTTPSAKPRGPNALATFPPPFAHGELANTPGLGISAARPVVAAFAHGELANTPGLGISAARPVVAATLGATGGGGGGVAGFAGAAAGVAGGAAGSTRKRMAACRPALSVPYST